MTFLPARDGACAGPARESDAASAPAFSIMTTRTPAPHQRPSRDFPLGSSPDSPFRLLGEAIRETSARADDTTDGLRALVTRTADYARLHGALLADYLGALESTLEVHATGKDAITRERLRVALRHWGRLAYGEADDRTAGDS